MIKSIAFVLCCLSFWAELIAGNDKPTYRTIVITKGDSTIEFSICPSSLKVNNKDHILYHWYSDNKLHLNRGKHSGRLVHGKVKTFDKNKNLVEFGEMKYGVKTGVWIKWYANGEIQQETKWKRGTKNGTEKYYSQSGELMMKRFYKNDRRRRKDIVYNNGHKVRPEKVKREKGEKKLKFLKFSEEEKPKEKRKEKENREKYQWFKNLLNKNENGDKV